MGQKAISVSSVNKNLTKAEKKIRQDVETTFAAIDKTLQPPEYFTADQKKIFNELVEKLSATKLLLSLDQTTFEQAAIIIDRLNCVDKMLNNPENIFNINATNIRQKYFSQYLKICAELALSPAARAKLGTLSANNNNNKNTDPLVNALGGAKP